LVRASQARLGSVAKGRCDFFLLLVRDDRDLALSALIGVTDYAPARDDAGAIGGVHRAAAHAFDPNLFESAHAPIVRRKGTPNEAGASHNSFDV